MIANDVKVAKLSVSLGRRIQHSWLFSLWILALLQDPKEGLLVYMGSVGFSLPSHSAFPQGSNLLYLFSQPAPITEVDGTVATDFFTVLSVAQHYTQDQWLNMQTFSMLRKWLLCYGGKEPDTLNPGRDGRSAGHCLQPQEGCVLSDVT